jgi:autotransporter translocation and assembly factor TamB
MKSNMWAAIALIFLIWAVGATAGMVYYYQTNQNQQKVITSLESIVDSTTMRVNIGVKYGNGTTVWYNGTYVPLGASAFNATTKVVTLNYSVTWGTYVTGINGVMENITSQESWFYYSWINGTKTSASVGVTEYILSNGEIITWEYEKWNF